MIGTTRNDGEPSCSNRIGELTRSRSLDSSREESQANPPQLPDRVRGGFLLQTA
jgi:hypothetical protein